MAYYDDEPYLKMTRSQRRIYCWIRRQRHILAVHKFIYYELSESIYEDLQFDYLERQLELIEIRYPEVSDEVTKEGYLSPSAYVDALDDPKIERRARMTLSNWINKGCPRIDRIPQMTGDVSERNVIWQALREIVRYPI